MPVLYVISYPEPVLDGEIEKTTRWLKKTLTESGVFDPCVIVLGNGGTLSLLKVGDCSCGSGACSSQD